MDIYIGITDSSWYRNLRAFSDLEEVNFWQPSGNRQFRSLNVGELFLFKLHSPNDYIVGGGIYAYSNILPVSIAWEAFGTSNGANNFKEMHAQIARYKKIDNNRAEDFEIGCILLEQPFFFEEKEWINIPEDWNSNIVQGKKYDMSSESGLMLFNQVQRRLQKSFLIEEYSNQYGNPYLVSPRLGQGTFRILVTDAYNRRCAITNERTLPALDAAHIKPYSEHGPNQINNGILLRRDLHALFDGGYITITPSMNVEVSRKIKEEYENGKDYYRYHGEKIFLPEKQLYYPNQDYLEWHNENIYKS